MVIFNGMESGEMLDFVGFCRTRYRSDFGYFLGDFKFLSRYMDRTDTLVFAAEYLF